MICEKCGKEIDFVNVRTFNYDGSDSLIETTFTEVSTGAVVFETTPSWTGYELSEEEMTETIECPYCKQFPFKSKEIGVYNIVQVVCFKEDAE